MNLEDIGEVLIKHIATPEMAVEYAGYDLYTGLWDPKTVADSMKKLIVEFKEPDIIRSIFFRSPRFYASLGSKSFQQSADGLLQHPEVHSMKDTEYADYNSRPFEFILENVIPRFFSVFDRPEPYRSLALAKGVITNLASVMGPYKQLMGNVLHEENLPVITTTTVLAPFDFIADYMRGFTGIVGDARRKKQALYDACEATLPFMLLRASTTPTGVNNMLFIPLHMPPFISEKVFSELWWPSFKEMMDAYDEMSYPTNVFFEGDWTRYLDYLQDLPKYRTLGRFEYTDPKIAKEKLSKVMCMQGFYPMSNLTLLDKATCVDKAKELLDIVAPGGGYIFNTDKLNTRQEDINFENLHAVYECVKIYGRN